MEIVELGVATEITKGGLRVAPDNPMSNPNLRN
jgi:hypothetical protein